MLTMKPSAWLLGAKSNQTKKFFKKTRKKPWSRKRDQHTGCQTDKKQHDKIKVEITCQIAQEREKPGQNQVMQKKNPKAVFSQKDEYCAQTAKPCSFLIPQIQKIKNRYPVNQAAIKVKPG